MRSNDLLNLVGGKHEKRSYGSALNKKEQCKNNTLVFTVEWERS